ncbi:hypothetical protein MVEG_02474 [Podila verticillata NRRL 6337]|nr:hypothetical protein MVEG_02474 [Podila verticillata NRRL 6337]
MPFEADPTPNMSARYETMEVPNPQIILDPPVVLIAGAGIGGLTAALLLERAGINYFVFERAAIVKPLGAALALNSNVLPCLSQLGLMDELMDISLPVNSLDMYKENLKPIGAYDVTSYKAITGFETTIFARRDLYELLLSKIPPSKVQFNKKIMSIMQNREGVMIRFSDNTHFHGDILIGADGAYSAVRQSLYKQLSDQDLLPASDKEEIPMAYLCMVGTTDPLDPEKYPALKDAHTHFSTHLGNTVPQSWTTITLKGNRVAWSIMKQLSAEESKAMMFRNSEWGPEANREMINDVSHFPIKLGGVLGDLIKATDKDRISRVYIEEKMFQTWNYGRTALIGDAAHKMQPSAGQGAVNAIQDAVILVNCIYDIENVTHDNIKAALADYKDQRFEQALFQMNNSRMIGRMMYGQKKSERMIRNIVYNLPKWVQSKNHFKAANYRPLINFLPPVENTTNLKLLPQKPSKRYAKEQAARAEETKSSDTAEPVIPWKCEGTVPSLEK